MVKESERKKTYHPRASHKEGCLCAPCKAKRAKLEDASPPPELEPEIETPTPSLLVRADSLPLFATIELNGEAFILQDAVEGMVVIGNTITSHVETIGGGTMVKMVKPPEDILRQ